jgi:hypothetical protein
MVPGVDSHVANAEAIKVVQAEMPSDAEAFPPPQDKQRVWVRDVLKGVDTGQEFLLPTGKLQPGQKAVVLFEYGAPGYSKPVLQTPPGKLPPTSVWPMDSAGNLNTGGVPARMASGETLDQWIKDTGETISLEMVKKDIAASSPEEVGLYGQVMDALLFPKKFQALARRNSGRATYVRFVMAIRQLNRDVPWLARLLESHDQTIRQAAFKRLELLTETQYPAPTDKSPRSLYDWAQSWAGRAALAQAPRWPPVPADLKIPPDAFPEPLIQALQINDAGAFAKAFAVWLDSGVMRDREICDATATLDRRITDGSNLEGAILAGHGFDEPASQPIGFLMGALAKIFE